ncbi:hypothetical protein SteCoe_18425 [Stentor coeruleus]|uniref:Uncharacterized protein n=1 Tax=Stentor coeruleus TaxID=5963 RepID=A0A1R2BWI8_9CILI|nr:hypothetical protein SteCoe_18425 [Stentor coeruleus]
MLIEGYVSNNQLYLGESIMNWAINLKLLTRERSQFISSIRNLFTIGEVEPMHSTKIKELEEEIAALKKNFELAQSQVLKFENELSLKNVECNNMKVKIDQSEKN